MVGIVIVSHSAKVAQGVRELAEQVAQGNVPLAVAGGIDRDGQVLGTDANLIRDAIESVYSDDGVLVLMDLGSAILAAEVAIELLPEPMRHNVHLSAAPLVEGTVAAATQAVISCDIEEIKREVQAALTAKAVHLGDTDLPTGTIIAPPGAVGPELVLRVDLEHGLHARPASRLVRTASHFKAEITLRNLTRNVGPVNAKSIGQVLSLGVLQGHKIGLSASGVDASEALHTLRALVEGQFDDLEPAVVVAPMPYLPSGPVRSGDLRGVAAAPGVAMGPLVRYRSAAFDVTDRHAEDSEAEWQRLRVALAKARHKVAGLRDRTKAKLGAYQAEIFDTQLLLLDDPDVIESAHQGIFADGLAAESAWQRAIGRIAAAYRNLDDDYLRARAADVTDAGAHVMEQLLGVVTAPLQLAEPSIVAATELWPSDIDRLDPERVLGICTELGSATSHSVILAQMIGIPTVVGLGPDISRIAEGTIVALDGSRGRLWIAPDGETIAEIERRRSARLEAKQAALHATRGPARTKDGWRVPVLANIRGVGDVTKALEQGAEGVGLLRTEFFYLDRASEPSEEEQVAFYRAVAEALGPRPLVIRTLDIGGDKPLPYMSLSGGHNPFLGLRGVRVGLAHPAILKRQVRAILRAGAGSGVALMFPMIACVSELRAAKAMVALAMDELRRESLEFADKVDIGIMIEVPAAVVTADLLAAEVSFFSIGTNDLSQYVMAADRTNMDVAALADPLQPAVVRMIAQTVKAARAAKIRVSLCGELAGEPLAVPLLLGLGIDELSMNATAVATAKQAIARIALSDAQAAIDDIMDFDSPADIRRYLRNRFGK